MNEGELRVRLINLCAAQARLTESATWPWSDDTPQRADRDHALEQIIDAVNHDRDAIAAVMRGDDDPAVFFRRGNACVSWDRVPEWARWVTVDGNGKVYASGNAPNAIGEKWCTLGTLKQVAAVGGDCEDWESLIFERPQVKPVITADEWEHIRWLSPNAVAVAKDDNGLVFAYTSREMVALETEWHSRHHDEWDNPQLVSVLQERFKDIPWRESAVYYKEDDKC